jgi:hypothetical protein
MRICTKCHEEKPENKFYRHKSIKPDGIRKTCNNCRNKYRKQNPDSKETKNKWTKKNRKRINAKARLYRAKNTKKFKSYTLKRDFGITLEQYETTLELQNGLCKLCNEPEKTFHQSGKLKDLAVDHDHLTGKIRGLLCWVCNTGIGKLKDSPELLRKAANYIEESRKTK